MAVLQDDLLEIYNNLTIFSEEVLRGTPIKVYFDKDGVGSPLVFNQKGVSVRLRYPIYYCLGLEDLKKPTLWLPEDYISSMENLKEVIMDQRIIDDRTLVSPENYGFDIYAIDKREFSKGLEILARIRFISKNSLLNKLTWRIKYGKY